MSLLWRNQSSLPHPQVFTAVPEIFTKSGVGVNYPSCLWKGWSRCDPLCVWVTKSTRTLSDHLAVIVLSCGRFGHFLTLVVLETHFEYGSWHLSFTEGVTGDCNWRMTWCLWVHLKCFLRLLLYGRRVIFPLPFWVLSWDTCNRRQINKRKRLLKCFNKCFLLYTWEIPMNKISNSGRFRI